MRTTSIITVVILTAVAAAAPSPNAVVYQRDSMGDVQRQANNLTATALQNVLRALDAREVQMRQQGKTPSCTSKNLALRKEYGSLSESERLAYVNAVKCLQNLPPKTPANVSTGARSRFDDFIVTHIIQTISIHFTGNFMPWHRWYLHIYEKALRDECGYTGYHPYWDWPKYESAPEKSPIFNGDPYSLGGNGESIPHEGPILAPPPGTNGVPVQFPPGVGGGYVVTGPFANMTINLGPVQPLPGTPTGPDRGLGYNPRRLKRDAGPAIIQRYANYTTIVNLLSKPNFAEYRILSEGIPNTPEIGPHGGGHFCIGGDPGSDLFTSPGDPAFWVHHGNMDRLWASWQALGSPDRYTDLEAGSYSHMTWMNDPPSAKTKLSDAINMEYAGPSITIGEVMDTTAGPFCYFYL